MCLFCLWKYLLLIKVETSLYLFGEIVKKPEILSHCLREPLLFCDELKCDVAEIHLDT